MEDETGRGYDEAAHRGNAYGIPEGLGGAFGTSGGGTYAGGFHVETRFGHAGRGPRGYQRPDERILDDAHDRLERDGWVDATDIELSIDAGEISLRGTVETREMRRRAEAIVDSISGVRHV
ncbi:MAG TPA: BON domain-containing protein, partial [Thermoanaerobaculia bacterium]|nr:BON domain-containing protein [Thermoanaerobaculia bacterium]